MTDSIASDNSAISNHGDTRAAKQRATKFAWLEMSDHHNPSELKPLLVSVREARRLLGGCGNNRFWDLVKTGQIELVGSSRKRWVPTASLEALIERMREEAREAREAKSLSATV